MKKTLRKVFSLALALMCCIATVSPISAKAEYITEKSADFSAATDDALFSTTYGGWSSADGVYKANMAWANAYLTEPIYLATNKVISFDFCLQNDQDTDHQFNVGLVGVSGSTISGGVTAHFYYSSQWSTEMATLNSEFGSATGGTWYADTTTNYFDGQKHTMTVMISDNTASFQIDGNDVFTSVSVGLEQAHLIFQATSTEYYVDNIKIETEFRG